MANFCVGRYKIGAIFGANRSGPNNLEDRAAHSEVGSSLKIYFLHK